MKKFIIVNLFVLFFIQVYSLSAAVEKVDVNWWVVPLFVVHKDNLPVSDLKKDDIQLSINDKIVSDFIIYKRSFNQKEKKVDEISNKVVSEKEKIIILLFDTVFSKLENLEKCKSIARDIVEKSDVNSKFVILKVDLFAGLTYIYGPGSDKVRIIDLLDKKIKLTSYGKNVDNILTIVKNAQISGSGPRALPKYTARGLGFIREEVATALKNTSRTFFLSFETLYFALNQIKDNKFIYLFSEGISYFARKVVRHSDEEFSALMKKSASLLGRSGSVIFIVNPATTTESFEAPGYGTGEDILKSLARESGGEYFEGAKESIKSRIENLNSSYYEIAFPDESDLKSRVKNIKIKTFKKGLKINTIKSIEKNKEYGEMNKIEKEVLVINLLNRDPFTNIPLKVEGLEIDILSENGKRRRVSFTLPPEFFGQYLDVYKINVIDRKVLNISRNVMLATKKKNITEVVSTKNSEEKIVIISKNLNKALVQGVFNPTIKMKKMLDKKKAKFIKYKKKMSEDQRLELSKILNGTAEYCEKLKSAVFHFVCIEDITETKKEIRKLREIKSSKYDYTSGVMISKREPGKADISGNPFWITKNRNIFDYQLIQDKKGIKEIRNPLKGKSVNSVNIMGKETFLSRKVVKIPIDILSNENQNKFYFRLISNKKLFKKGIALIEAFPKDFFGTGSIFGKLWIDLEDFSIKRMVVNPISIGGYKKLLDLADRIGSVLNLKIDIRFDKKWNDIRFPTGIRISESYFGGWFLNRVSNTKFFERVRTDYKYKNYRFFNVDTEVKIEKK